MGYTLSPGYSKGEDACLDPEKGASSHPALAAVMCLTLLMQTVGRAYLARQTSLGLSRIEEKLK